MNDLRARTGVGHGQQSRFGVLELEVLVGKLLAVDGLATSALLAINNTLAAVSIPSR